ncbi:MAG TPA: hypothetical protein PLJ17_02205 [Syntrophorhabdaceae bacterium]|nr:hypothetical protein [Caldisericia bacterium]HQH42582.1 hypothetical protein [Syntrophorhabdaceae bacterium]
MSVRAYRINKIDYEKSDTFNLWHHVGLVEILEDHGLLLQLNEDLNGILSIPVDLLEKIAKEHPDITDQTNLLKDIEWAKALGEYDVTYYCF